MKLFFVVILSLLVFNVQAQLKEEIELFYYDRPPLFTTDSSGKPSGLVIANLEKALANSKYRYTYKNYPPKRQLNLIAENKSSVCGIGWFETQERKTFGQFSAPIFEDAVLVLVTHHKYKIKSARSLKNLFKRKDLIFLKKNGFSYGYEVDAMEKEIQPNKHVVSTPIESMLEMIAKRERYYLLVDANEFEYILSLKPELKEKVMMSQLTDVTTKNKRHLLCSFKTPAEFLKSIRY